MKIIQKSTLRNFLILTIVGFLTGCSSKLESKTEVDSQPPIFNQYSEFVKDTFYINVQLPNEYYEHPDKNYPSVYELDGNFYFPITSPIARQYESTGLLEPFILVSIGYKNFQLMDSLRVRDYLYPKSIPSDEMDAIGGGQNFKKYITNELIPKIDREFRTDKTDRTLFGHSFGGYFVLYALADQIDKSTDDFKSFISASPTLWYNNFYLKQLPEKLKNNKESLNIFLSVGGTEDSTWSVNPVVDISTEIEKMNLEKLNFKNRVFSNLDHMDVGLISFIKGLQELKQPIQKE